MTSSCSARASTRRTEARAVSSVHDILHGHGPSDHDDVIPLGLSVSVMTSPHGVHYDVTSLCAGLDLDSEGSSSDAEVDPDSRSTTSFEEMSKLHPDLLLFKAAQVCACVCAFWVCDVYVCVQCLHGL